MRNIQVRDDAYKKQEAAKMAKKLGAQNKAARPTMPIYRPPSIFVDKHPVPSRSNNGEYQQMCKNGPIMTSQSTHNVLNSNQFGSFDPPIFTGNSYNRAVHFQDQNKGFSVSYKNQEGPVYSDSQLLKSALKRSKSFGGTNETAILDAEMGFEKEALSSEYQALVRKALTDPNALSSRQLMEVVRVLCLQAITAVKSAEPAARMCFKIIEKEINETFLESLLNSCREWFNERDKLRRHNSSGGSWTAYVSFLLELYLKLKDHQRSHLRDHSGVNSESALATQKLTLVTLIYECCFIILMPPSMGSSAEIECLRSTLTTAGKYLEQDSKEKMDKLCFMMKDAFLTVPQEPFRKTLLELIELRASNWEMSLPQTIYYFPYTARLF